MKAEKNTAVEGKLPNMQVTMAETSHIYGGLGNKNNIF